MIHLNLSRVRARSLSLAVGMACLIATGPALAEGNKANGEKLAGQWCNSCHTVSTGESRRMFDAGPPFVELAKKSEDYLKTAVNRPHDFMPKFPKLSASDKSDLIAYIRSLN